MLIPMLNKKTDTNLLSCVLLIAALLLFGNSFGQSNDAETANAIVPGEPAIDSADFSDEDSHEQKVDEQAFNPISPASDTTYWRELPPDYFGKLRSEEAFSYVENGIPRPAAPKSRGVNFYPFKLSNAVLYTAIAVFIAFLIWYLFANNIIFVRRKPVAVKEDATADDPDDIYSIQYKLAIERALQQRNYRLAIRLHYLQLLKTLADKKIINYRPERTNFDYLHQLRPTDYYNEFFVATRNYEYSWYGLFDISEQQYRKMQQGFDDFNKRLS